MRCGPVSEGSSCNLLSFLLLVSSLQLQMLVKAGADVLMPVMVDGDVGTAMDYAYYSFHQVKPQVQNAAFP